ncbi:MAG: type IV pilin protein [Steroidobacteraceae bacterium]
MHSCASKRSIFSRRVTPGFTLIELLLTIVIASVLAMIAIPSYQKYIVRAKTSQAIADISRIKLGIDRYRLNQNDGLPASLADIGYGTLTDPWGHNYVYLNFSTVHGNGQKRKDRNLVPINTEFDLYSKGPDGNSASPLTAAMSRDDIIMANDGGYVGKASDY